MKKHLIQPTEININILWTIQVFNQSHIDYIYRLKFVARALNNNNIVNTLRRIWLYLLLLNCVKANDMRSRSIFRTKLKKIIIVSNILYSIVIMKMRNLLLASEHIFFFFFTELLYCCQFFSLISYYELLYLLFVLTHYSIETELNTCIPPNFTIIWNHMKGFF